MALISKLEAIGDAIREKTGGTDLLTLDGMAEAIAGIQAGGGGDADDMVMGTITEYSSDNVTTIRDNAFSECGSITAVSFPNATYIGGYAFEKCKKLTSVNLPNVTSSDNYVFTGCEKLKTVNLPKITHVGSYLFSSCKNLTSINLPSVTRLDGQAFGTCEKLETAKIPNVTHISNYSFIRCYSLVALVIEQTDGVCNLVNTDAFSDCYHILGTVNSKYNPEGLKDGYIYVPDALVEDYKAATKWSTYADQIKPLSEYVEVTE